MVAYSKLFKDGIEKGLCCKDLAHSGPCKTTILFNTYKFLLSNMKYFAPVVFLPLVVHIRSLTKEGLMSTLKYYVDTVAAGTMTGWSISVMICVFRHIFGKFGYYTFIFWPTVLGSLTLWIVPNLRMHRLFQTSVFQCTIESLIMQQKTLLTKLIYQFNLIRTLIFMCCSGLILNAKRDGTYKGFWLLEPTPGIVRDATGSIDENSNGKTINASCNHLGVESCTRYALQGARNYMIIGVTLDVIKMLFGKVTTTPMTNDGRSAFLAKLIGKLKNFKPQSCAILTSYIALYRLLHCYFNRNYGGDNTLNHTLAAILSGSCFIFYPKLTLLCYALVLALQISWQHLNKHIATDQRYAAKFEWLNRLPCAKLFYPIALGYLVNTYVIRKYYVGSVGEAIVNGVTNNYAKTINQNVVQLERQLESSLAHANA